MSQDQKLLHEAYKNPKYSGKHIIIIGGKIHASRSGRRQFGLLVKLVKEYPKETPTIAYIPKENTLILFI